MGMKGRLLKNFLSNTNSIKFMQLLLLWQAPKSELTRLTYIVIDFEKDAAWGQLIR
jgi:hypothetical protein